MTELTKRVKKFELEMKTVVEQSGLPPVVIDLVLTNVLNQIKNIEEQEVDPNAELHKDNVGEQSGTID